MFRILLPVGRLLLPVIVCYAIRASFGNYFMFRFHPASNSNIIVDLPNMFSLLLAGTNDDQTCRRVGCRDCTVTAIVDARDRETDTI